MVSEFVVVWVELNWLRDVAGSAFLVKRDAREACAACRRGFVGGWLLGCRESAPLLQSPATGSTRLTGWLFRAVG